MIPRRWLALLAALVFSQLGVIFIQDSGVLAGAPQVRGVGSFGKAVGVVYPGLPTGTVEGDLLIAMLETANQAITAPGGYGWVEHANSPSTRGSTCPASSDCTRLTVFYRLATASETSAGRKFSDSGDHQCGLIMGIEAGTFDAATPMDAGNANNQSATTSVNITGATTTTTNTLVLAIGASTYDCNGCPNFSGWSNANLADLTERLDNSCQNGNGGSLAAATGGLATARPAGNTSATSAVTQARANIFVSINAD